MLVNEDLIFFSLNGDAHFFLSTLIVPGKQLVDEHTCAVTTGEQKVISLRRQRLCHQI